MELILKKILQFGDVHFSAMNKWNIDAGNYFINWFENQNFGPKDETEFMFAGDLAERDVNPGVVIDQMVRLIKAAANKGKSVWVLVGNHDKKLYHDVLQNSLQHLENIEGVTVVNECKTVITPLGFKVLFMPHLHSSEIGNKTLNDYYNELINSDGFLQDWDICCGHWNFAEGVGHGFRSDGIDISKLRPHVKCWALGHIHTRVSREYLGSIWPNKFDEQFSLYKRCYKEFNENQQVIEMPLPEFLHYEDLEFGKEVPEQSKNCAYVYTIVKCQSEKLAKEKYLGIYIRGVEQREKADFSGLSSDKSLNDFNKSYLEYYKEMMAEIKPKVTRGANVIITNFLKELDEQVP